MSYIRRGSVIHYMQKVNQSMDTVATGSTSTSTVR